MSKLNVLTLVGGISSTSINKRFYNEIVKHNTGDLAFELFDIAVLPFYTQDRDQDQPALVKSLKEKVRSSNAVLFITPEYNRSYPGVLKNAIDQGSRPYGDNCWNGKPAAIIGASIGPIGTFGAQQHLRNVCSYLNMRTMSQPEVYFNASAGMNDNGLTDETVKMVQKFLQSFEAWIKQHQ